MSEEKELVRKIKNSIKAKKSKSEITRKLQQKGYKLEYINALMKKAIFRRKVAAFISLMIIVSLAVAVSTYSLIFAKEKNNITNPLQGLAVKFTSAPTEQNIEKTSESKNQQPSKEQQIHIEEVEITSEFISYLLNEIGAWQLHKHPITLEEPIINVQIEEKEFTSIIDHQIITEQGLNQEADIQFNTNKQDLIEAMVADNPEEVFKQSVKQGKTQIQLISSQTELFAKGYKNLYDSLN